MKFEAKLNEMHGELRDLNTRHARALAELKAAQDLKDETLVALTDKKNEFVDQTQELVDLKNRMTNQIEKIASLEREINIKANQVMEFKERIDQQADEFELSQYKVVEQQKQITE